MWRWDPDTFGSVAPTGTLTYNLRFPGQYSLSESGLYYNYFRDYDPQTGRYLESDPMGLYGGSWSPYLYASGDPILYVDPFGLCWVYSQSTGQLTYVDPEGDSTYIGTGYAGIGAGLNNPAMQDVPNVGPLTQGLYTIGPQQDYTTTEGKVLRQAMVLTPNPNNQMFHRGGFLIHGPHRHDRHNSSNGCPIFNSAIRNQIAKSDDKCFEVVP
jgi:RHS repeat-associated protein